MPFLREKSGKWSAEKIAAFVGACIPALWLAWRAWSGDLNPARPVNEAIHSTGNYAVWLVVLSLAVTPARRLFNAPKLINMRRTLGVAAFCYAVLHLTLYVVQEKYDLAKVVSEIVFRIYLTIGFVALIGLIALAATSTDGMIRRLGATLEHAAQNRLSDRDPRHHPFPDADQARHFRVGDGGGLPVLAARLPADASLRRRASPISGRSRSRSSPPRSPPVAEAAWYGATTGVMWWRVFAVNLDWEMALRPAHWVLSSASRVTLAAFAWSF